MTTLDAFINPKKEENLKKEEKVAEKIEEPIKELKKEIPEKKDPKENYVETFPKKEQVSHSQLSKPWMITYTPQHETEIIGNKKSVLEIKKFIETFKSQKKKALLLWGPSGTGKSCSVYAFANQYQYELIELNASSRRNKAAIEELLGSALKQQSLFGKSKIILIDDLDGVSGFKDRGGASAIAKLIPESNFPILITCQDPFSDKVKPVAKKSQLVSFNPISEKEIMLKLKKILDEEKIRCDNSSLQIIAEHAQGDLRAAINDIQMLSIGKNEIDKTLLDELSERLQNKDMKKAIKEILKGTEAKEVINAFNEVQGNALDEGMLWLDYNIPKEYLNKLDRARAYGCLTRADVFSKRIMRRQHWRFLVYINALLTAGIATSKEKPYTHMNSYQQSSRIFKLWQAKMKYGKRKNIAEKIAKKTHNSSKDIIKDFSYYGTMIKHNMSLQEEFELDKDEIAYIEKITST